MRIEENHPAANSIKISTAHLQELTPIKPCRAFFGKEPQKAGSIGGYVFYTILG
ncbi:hypothetical protein [Chitinophaga nivalis]|uniref:Uncharacterized protein n=1 Tax=Chitinophaga nivalis TaxID=2991709 RepID=A0ABT3IJZ2_9BACT|nr:hypothetical protein [Chitinophaga nivalis]MCW3466041.1 hypothetical protein [Chitinophaga nivalis]MCW3484268.1 hypothetical protein [Chitinophaga nivalis]